MKKIILITAIIGVVIGFFAFDLHLLFTLETLQARLAEFQQWRDSSPILVSLLFFAVYVLVTALSLPGAVIMTLAAGGLFGLLWGLTIVSFASTIGATLAFLVARYLLRDRVQKRFGDRLQTINEGMECDGALYLFSLRLVPIFPFFLINILLGLTPIRTITYYWVSQLGMLPATIVFINAGTQLAGIKELEGILSPGLLISFVLLGLFPLIAKKVVQWLRRRKDYL